MPFLSLLFWWFGLLDFRCCLFRVVCVGLFGVSRCCCWLLEWAVFGAACFGVFGVSHCFVLGLLGFCCFGLGLFGAFVLAVWFGGLVGLFVLGCLFFGCLVSRAVLFWAFGGLWFVCAVWSLVVLAVWLLLGFHSCRNSFEPHTWKPRRTARRTAEVGVTKKKISSALRA